MPPIRWNELFTLSVSPFEVFIRGTIIYLFIFVLMRVLRREPGTVGIADLQMVVLIADAYLYHLLGYYDEDLRKIFKVRADFDTVMDKNNGLPTHQLQPVFYGMKAGVATLRDAGSAIIKPRVNYFLPRSHICMRKH